MLSGLFSAKLLAAGIAVTMMVTTVSIYAAGISGTTKALGGTGANPVASAASAADVRSYQYNSSGAVEKLSVQWTPAASSIYRVSVVLTGTGGGLPQTYSCIRASSGTDSRSDTITVSTPVDPTYVTGAMVNIQELASGSTTCES